MGIVGSVILCVAGLVLVIYFAEKLVKGVCFNARIIGLVRPLEVSQPVLTLYLPVCALTVLATTVFMLVRKVPRWAGAVLVVLYVVFAIGGYLESQLPPAP